MTRLFLILALLLPAVAEAAPCRGKTPCNVCKDCSRCRWCNPARAPKDVRPKPHCGACKPIHLVNQ